MPRRFITVDDVDRLVDEGTGELTVGPDTTVTDLAQELARERGLRLVWTDAPTGTTDPAVPVPVPGTDRGRFRAGVRSAVIARLGWEPPQLDRIIDRVLNAADPPRSTGA